MMKARIIVLAEKYGTYYLDASTRDAFLVSCLMTVERRIAENSWYHKWNIDEVSKPDLELDIVETLPDGETKTSLLQAWDRYDSHVKEVEENNELVSLARIAADTKDPFLAWHVLTLRENHEYEGFNIETLESPLGIQHVRKRPKMKPKFALQEALDMIHHKLKVENAGRIEAAQRRFENLSSEEFTLGGIMFSANGHLCATRTVPIEVVKLAEEDGRLKRIEVKDSEVRLWNIDSVHCLDAEDMIFAYWYSGEKGTNIKPHIIHVYEQDGLKRLNITRFISPFGLTSNEWEKLGLYKLIVSENNTPLDIF